MFIYLSRECSITDPDPSIPESLASLKLRAKALITIFMMADGEIVTLNGALHASSKLQRYFFQYKPHVGSTFKEQGKNMIPTHNEIPSYHTRTLDLVNPASVYFCGVSIRRVQSREFRRQRRVMWY